MNNAVVFSHIAAATIGVLIMLISFFAWKGRSKPLAFLLSRVMSLRRIMLDQVNVAIPI